MSLNFCSTQTFRQSVERLCKRRSDNNHSCEKDISKHLKDWSFNDIFEMKMRLKDLGEIRVLKIRIPNSHQNLSSSNGWRLIVCCHKKYECIALLNIYPKRGKGSQLDQSPEETKNQLREYLANRTDNTLVEYKLFELDELPD